MKRAVVGVCVAWLGAVGWVWDAGAQSPQQGDFQFSNDGQLVRPLDYREWVFLTSGLGMTYATPPPTVRAAGTPAGAAPAADRSPFFDNVFVTRDAYREFMRSGRWPDRTMFILEIRKAVTNVSINNGGHTQGDITAVEAAVKDPQRFGSTGGWGYFTFDGPSGLTERAAPLPATAACYACHSANTAVDNTFVQFYPELFTVAKRHGTIKPTYDPAKKVERR